YDATGGKDGRVSIEVEPGLAHDAAGTIAEAKQLWAKVDRPNAMIKIPATIEGLEAIAETIGAGISVNVTLIFSLERHREVINAYLTGLEKARAAGLDLS
ncbi:MAG TPA: transaldolase, partial [Microbacteriaceae bacterium]|nr:transaldolase [Microbacteriaceae bacterium]